MTDLNQRLLAVIGRGVDTPLAEPEFDRLACEVFATQYAGCAIYRAYCDRQGATPERIRGWAEIPAVPTAAFKDFVLAGFPLTEAMAEFHTSGTTRAQTGRHYFRSLDLYHAALLPNFVAHLLPDRARLPLFILTPSPADAPHSSLAHMLGHVLQECGTVDSGFYVDVRGSSPSDWQLDLPRLVRDLCAAQWDQQPVALLGTSFALAHLLDHCTAEHLRFELSPGSRVMDTGGFKGRTRAVSRAELYRQLTDQLGIPATHLVNEYGMTELSSQFYDRSLRDGTPTETKAIPPWTRIQIIDPHTGAPAAVGCPGLVRVYDLANVDSILAIQTEDLGRLVGSGFTIAGRAAGAERRGCSLDAEALATRAEPFRETP